MCAQAAMRHIPSGLLRADPDRSGSPDRSVLADKAPAGPRPPPCECHRAGCLDILPWFRYHRHRSQTPLPSRLGSTRCARRAIAGVARENSSMPARSRCPGFSVVRTSRRKYCRCSGYRSSQSPASQAHRFAGVATARSLRQGLEYLRFPQEPCARLSAFA